MASLALFLLLLVSSLNANSLLEESTFERLLLQELEPQTPTITEKIIFAKPITLPKNIYQSQILKVTVEAIIADDNYDRIQTTFINSKGLTILSDDALWQWKQNSDYTLSYFVQINKKQFKLPDLNTTLIFENSTLDHQIIKGIDATAQYVNHNNDFSNLIADKLIINNQKLETYDENQNIFVLELESMLGNLNEFHLNNIQEQGIDWHERKLPSDKIFYYGIIPNKQSTLDFNYFNLNSRTLQKVNITFDMSNLGQKTSTQIEINPNKQKYPYLEIALYGGSFLIAILLFFFRKSLIYLFIALLILAAVIYNFRSKEILIKSDTHIYLLPTKNASSFYTTEAILQTQVLHQRKEYIKIQLPDQKIGWVRRKDVY